MQRLRRAGGGGLDDDAALLSMAREVLAGPGDDGRAPYQVSLTFCTACGSAGQQAGGELVPVGAEIASMAECDAQHLGQLLPRAANENAIAPVIEPGSHGPNEASDVDARVGVGARVGASPDTAAADDDAHLNMTEGPLGAADSPFADATSPARDTADRRHPSPRAKQTIPPALRRAVLTRDQHRCRVPGCTHTTFVDVHHIVPRSEGGRNEPANLLTLCGAHHRAVHRGELIIEQSAEGNIRFRHADGTRYGQPVTPHAVDVQAKVFSALRHLGFREREVRAVLAELRDENDLQEPNAEDLLREALRRIRPAPK